ncbi:MAG: hypothetical protein LBU97_05900 [Alistipes sp.]|jgi:hypothetical protein|nr:hypothetical protein [Alistipes sp.]
MKKTLILFTVAAMVAIGAGSQAAVAQGFQKGDWRVGVQFSDLLMQYAFNDDMNVKNLDIAAEGGYFLSEKFAIDAMLELNYSNISTNNSASTNLALGAALRYYPVGNFFVRAGYDIGLNSFDDGSDSWLDARVGYDWFLSDRVFLEPALVYTKNFSDGGFNNLSLALGFGVRF